MTTLRERVEALFPPGTNRWNPQTIEAVENAMRAAILADRRAILADIKPDAPLDERTGEGWADGYRYALREVQDDIRERPL